MNTPEPTQLTTIPTQRQRWVKYGVNVGVLLLALFAILFFFNYIAHNRFVRLDFTNNRRYTLSPQTTRLLQRLDAPVTITTLYSSSDSQSEKLAKIDDLLAEYKRRGSKVTVDRIDPSVDLPRFEKFLEKMLAGFSGEVKARKEIVAEALKMLDDVEAFSTQQTESVKQLQAKLDPKNKETTAFCKSLSEFFSLLAQSLPKAKERLKKIEQSPLMDFDEVRSALLSQQEITSLEVISKQAIKPAVTNFSELIEEEATPTGAKDQLLAMRSEYRKLDARVVEQLEKVAGVTAGEYDEVLARLQNQNCVAVMVERPAVKEPDKTTTESGPAIAVLTLDDLYPGFLSTAEAGGQKRPEQSYKGEEAITGALLKLTVKHKTRVIFVNAGSTPVLMGQPGQHSYQVVAQRLDAMNIKVEEWQPAGGTDRLGRPIQPKPKPTAAEGETLIFVALPPGPPPDPRFPFNPAAAPAQEAVVEEIAAGRPVLVITEPTSMIGLGTEENPITKPLGAMGVQIAGNQVILRPATGGDKGATSQQSLNVTQGDHIISAAIRGLPGIMLAAQPINFKPTEGVKFSPLVTTASQTWADVGALPLSPDRIAQLSNDPEKPQGPFTVAAAVEKGKQRIVVVTDPIWASDYVTTASQPVLTGRRDIAMFSFFPANTELFVNSIYWLAGLDDLIAPSARSQDIRRIGSVGDSTLTFIRLSLIGLLPLACLAAGVVVWFVRRK